jgi:putative ABC transport system permease protein
VSTVISLTPRDLAVASSLIVVDAVLSLIFQLRLHWRIAIASLRMVVQLVAIGFVLRFIFALNNPAATLLLILIMVLVAARETAARPERRFKGQTTLAIGAGSVAFATLITALFALTTALRPHPWYDPRYAIPLAGILLGNILNATSLSLDSFLGGIARERPAVEARLTLGQTYWEAATPFVRDAIRRGLVPIINQMSAAGVVTLPGIMTGQILAGLDPIEAVKYQILLMFLLAGGSGLAAAGAAYLAAWGLTDDRQRLRLDRLTQARTG